MIFNEISLNRRTNINSFSYKYIRMKYFSFSPVVVLVDVIVVEVLVVKVELETFVDVVEGAGVIVEVEVEPIVPIFSLHKGPSQRHSSTLNRPWKASCSLQPSAASPRGLQFLRHCNEPL